ncbi:MAG TPA: cytochrome c [Polyangia bacterium]|jgi:mono/diheme cytochrome c family protein
MMTRAATLALASILLMGAACNEQIFDPMADHRQPRERAYRPSNFFESGLVMQAAPAGTVPRERRTMNPTLTSGISGYTGQVAANGERVVRYASRIPVPVTPELLALGRKRYDITCGTCHGPLGDGDSIVAKQMALRPPPSLHNYANRAPGYIFEVATRGFGLMASYAAELTVEERWAVVSYVRALQVSQNVPAAELPADVQRQLDGVSR